jgi:branched-chain amino acid transport system substrate-binding protein
MIIFQAIDKAAIDAGGGKLLIPKKALRDAMFATNDYPGLTGNLTCKAYGDCADPKIAVYESFDPDPAKWDPGAGEESDPRKVWP